MGKKKHVILSEIATASLSSSSLGKVPIYNIDTNDFDLVAGGEQFTSKYLISGGASWSGTGLVYDVTTLEYYFNGNKITAPTQVTLDASDPVDNRLDAIVVDESEVVSVITGTAASSPITPSIPENQLLVQYILVEAGSTQPTIAKEDIYLENAEWTTSTYTTGTATGSIDFDNTVSPKQGVKCISANADARLGARFVRATSFDPYQYTMLSLWVRFTGSNVATNKSLNVRFENGAGSLVANTINLFSFGLQRNLLDVWQLVVVPITSFGALPTSVKGLKIIMTRGTVGQARQWDMDYLILTNGSVPYANVPTIVFAKDDTVIGSAAGINIKEGTGMTITSAINPTTGRADYTFNAAGGSSPISTTYADFYTLITGGNLQAGRTYILVDFRTVYDQMDFDNDGSLKPTLTTKQGAVEEIWVYALSNNQIASRAYSKTYPNDQIQYDWTYNVTAVNGSPAYGRISERIDEWNNRTDYDHRVIKFIRYDDGAGKFTVINDNGNASQEFLTFGNTYGTNTGEIIAGNYLGDYYVFSSFFGQEYPNNVFHATTLMYSNKLGLCYNNTWGDGNHSNNWGDGNYSNNWGDYNNYNNWGGYNYSNNWGNNNNSNNWGDSNYSNNWGDSNNYNTWENDNNYNTWGNNNNANTWDNQNNSNTWGNYNYSNTWGNYNYSNTWGDNNYKNTWGNGNNYNTWGNYNSNNTWEDNNLNNTWGNNNSGNTWGNENSGNTFGNNNSGNTWGHGNYNNTWGNDNNENTWDNYNNSNTWGNNNNANTWGNDNNGNTWGNDNNYNNFENNNQNNTFTHSTFMRYLNINSNLQGKTIDDVTYPIVFNTNFKKEIIQASNGNYYIKTFDGTTDQYILIP